MPRRDCPQCRKRLPYAARRCALCGWLHFAPIDETRAARAARRRTALWVMVALTFAVGGGIATTRAAEFADWYAGFAAQHLPERASSFAPIETDRGAFLFCARRVARTMANDQSVETFPRLDQTEMDELGGSRFRIRSWVDEERVDGQRVRHGFTCTVRFERGRWALEELVVGNPYVLTSTRP